MISTEGEHIFMDTTYTKLMSGSKYKSGHNIPCNMAKACRALQYAKQLYSEMKMKQEVKRT